MCQYCEPSHGRKMIRIRIKTPNGYYNLIAKIGKSWRGWKFKDHRLMIDEGSGIGSIKINYCPFCGRKLKETDSAKSAKE